MIWSFILQCLFNVHMETKILEDINVILTGNLTNATRFKFQLYKFKANDHWLLVLGQLHPRKIAPQP